MAHHTDRRTDADSTTQTNDASDAIKTIVTSTEMDPSLTIVADSSGIDVKIWGIWWPIHRYGFATLFMLLCIYALYASALRMYRNRSTGGVRTRKSVQPVFTSINVLVFILGLCNAIILYFDPYLFNQNIPYLLGIIIINMPYPCMTSAFALVIWVLISISQMRITKSSKIRSVGFLTFMILAHFLLIIGTCLFAVLVYPLFILGLICHGFSVLWGAFLCLAYIYSAWKIMSADRQNRKTLQDISIRDTSVVGTDSSYKRISKRLSSIFNRSSKHQKSDKQTIYSIGQNGNLKQSVPTYVIDGKSNLTVIDDVKEDTSDAQTSDTLADNMNMGPANQDSSVEKEEQTSKDHSMNDKNNDIQATKDKTMTECGQDVSKVTGKGRMTTPLQTGNGTRDRKSASKAVGTGRPQKSTQKVFRISAITTMLGVAMSGLGLYGILGLTVASADDQPSVWGWYAFQTCFRFVEFGMGCTMAYFTTQPVQRRRQR